MVFVESAMIFFWNTGSGAKTLKGTNKSIVLIFFLINIYIRVREIVPMFAMALQSHIVLVTNESLPYGWNTYMGEYNAWFQKKIL